eukprot:gnl/TRDRNA2_/TRDRNA2_161272_c0_seq1.p1 gnl/TRDRNA2_/TRDRNA2_161272_c0~~gnl/TRDRNA2_/TRDRNA2_161272_c0_seq1.p1  ORF type:complete len:370 (-),score=47.63 gnl/TRDRNA2_/TRDRNA2_161272_c0_seq1:187-1296(-)
MPQPSVALGDALLRQKPRCSHEAGRWAGVRSGLLSLLIGVPVVVLFCIRVRAAVQEPAATLASALAPRVVSSQLQQRRHSAASSFPAASLKFHSWSPHPSAPWLSGAVGAAAPASCRAAQRGCSVPQVVARASGSADVSVILLSAGVGKRMGAQIPKQYLKLSGREIALRSLDVFLACDSVAEIVIVSAEEYRNVFEEYVASLGLGSKPSIKYASGGKERQDSVANGLDQVSSDIVAVHDAARPLVTIDEVERVIADARECGAALLAVPTKATVKQALPKSGDQPLVDTTPDRSLLWEAHTPQVIRTELLRRGFEHAAQSGMAVTDDVSLVEALGEPVRLTCGEYTNIKLTTPEDMTVAEAILSSRGQS